MILQTYLRTEKVTSMQNSYIDVRKNDEQYLKDHFKFMFAAI